MSHDLKIEDLLGFDSSPTSLNPNNIAAPSAQYRKGLITHDNFTDYASQIADMPFFNEHSTTNQQFSAAGTTPARFEVMNEISSKIEHSEGIKELLSELGSNNKTFNKMAADSEKALARNATKVYAAAKKLSEQHEKAIAVLHKGRDKALQDLTKEYGDVFKQITDVKPASGANVTLHGVTIAVDNDKAKQKLLSDLKSNFDHSKERILEVASERVDLHMETIKEATSLVEKVEKETGIKNTLGFAKGESTLASTMDKAVSEAAHGQGPKGASGFVKLGSTTLGALVGGWIGHQTDKEGSQTGTIIGAGIGGVGGYLGSSMVSNLSKAATRIHA